MKNVEKVFTKNRGKDIIEEKHNLFHKKKLFYEREGLIMEIANDIVLNEIINKLNIVERMLFKNKIIKVYKAGVKTGFNWNNSDVR